jgi:16S rRNA (cytosine967-C5)-methyltransferase
MNAKQREILDAYASFPRPGGRLVYATCSVLEEENGAIVEDFLSRHGDYRLVPVSSVVEGLADTAVGPALRGALAGATTMQLYPHAHGTDGFFVAIFERR